jgi:hypothetical protein
MPHVLVPNPNWHCRPRGDLPSCLHGYTSRSRKICWIFGRNAHIIRNAGGRASDDAIRSLVISYKLLGTQEWFVVHHSDCGMQLFDDAIMSGLLEQSLQTATIDEKGWHDHGHGPGSVQGHYVKWLTFKDLKASAEEDVNASDHILCARSYPDLWLLLRGEDRAVGRSAGSDGCR